MNFSPQILAMEVTYPKYFSGKYNSYSSGFLSASAKLYGVRCYAMSQL